MTAPTTTKPAVAIAAPPSEATSAGALAKFQPPRLPYHPALEKEYGVTKGAWKALVEAVFPLAQSVDSIALALSYCKARKLDVFKRPVHIVPIWDKNKKKMVDTIWPGISELRTTAFRTKQYAGADPAEFGPMADTTFTSESDDGSRRNLVVRHPEWCQLTVYRMVEGQRVPVPGPRVYWKETYSRIGRTELPNDMWQKRPMGQLEKCAEAAALRRAFPEEIGNEHIDDEMGGHTDAEGAIDITPVRADAPATLTDSDGVVLQYADEAPPTEDPVPVSPLTLKGRAAEAAWVEFAKWLAAAVSAAETRAEGQAILDAHPKEWKEMQSLRAPDARAIFEMLKPE